MANERELTIVVRAREQAAEVLARIVKATQGVNVSVEATNRALKTMGHTTHEVSQGFTTAQARVVSFDAAINLLEKAVSFFHRIAEVAFDQFIADAQKFTSVSRYFNIPVEALSALSFVAESTGASFDGLTFGLRKFAVAEQKALDGNAETVAAFKAIGFQASDVKRLVGQDLITSFFEVAGALSKIQNQAERATIAFRLFGRGGRDAVTVGLDPARKELLKLFEALGGTWSQQAVDKFRSFEHAALETKVGIRALFRDLLVGSGVLDALNGLLEHGINALVAFRKHPGELGAAMLAVGRAFSDVITAVGDFLSALFGGGGATNGLRLVAVAAEATAVAIEKLAGFLRDHTEIARAVSIAITTLTGALIVGAAAWAFYQAKAVAATFLTTLAAPFTALLGVIGRVPAALRAVNAAFAEAQAAQAVGTGFAALGTSITVATQRAAGLQSVTKGISEAALAQQALRVAAINATPAIANLSAAMQINAADAVLAGKGGAAIKAAFATEAAAAGAVGEGLAGLGVSMAAAETATAATAAVTAESVGVWGTFTAALALVGKGILAVVAFIGGWPVVIAAALAAFVAYIIGWKNLWAAVMAIVHLLVAVWDVLYYAAGKFFGALPEWFASLRTWLLNSVPGLQRFVDLFVGVTEKVEGLARRIKGAIPATVAVPPALAAPTATPFYTPQQPSPLAPVPPPSLYTPSQFTPAASAGIETMRARLKGLLSGQLDAKEAADTLKAALLDLGQAGKASGDGLGEGGKKAQEFAAKLKELKTVAADTQLELEQQKAFLVQLQNVPAGTTVEGIKQIVDQQKLALEVSKNRIEADKAINEIETKFKGQPGVEEAVAAVRATQSRKDALAALTPEIEKARAADEYFIKTMGQAATATRSATGGELELLHLTNQLTDRAYELAKAENAAREANITDPAKIAQLKQLAGALYDAKQNAAGMTSVFDFLADTGKDFFNSIITGGRGFKDFMKTVPASIEKGFVEGFFKGLKAKTNFDKLFEVNIFTLVKNMGEFLTGSRGIGDIFEGAFGGATAATKTATDNVVKTVAGLAPAINQSVQPVSHALTQSFADWDKGAQTASRNVASYAHDGASATITAAQSMSNAEIAASAKAVDAAGATAGANVQAANTSQSAWGSFFQFLLQIIGSVVSTILSLFSTLATTLLNLLGSLGSALASILGGIGNLLSGGGGGGGTGSVVGGVVNFVQSIFGTGGLIAKGFGFVTDLFGGGGGGGGFFGFLTNAASSVFGSDGVIGKYFTAIKGYFTGGKLGSVFSTLGSLAAVIGGGFAVFQGVMALFSKRSSALQRVFGGGEAILGLASIFHGLQGLIPAFRSFAINVAAAGVSPGSALSLGGGNTVGLGQFAVGLFSKAGFGQLVTSIGNLTTTLGNLASPLTTLVQNLVGYLLKALTAVLPSLAAAAAGSAAGSGAPVVATIIAKTVASQLATDFLGAIALPVAVIGALYAIYQGIQGVVSNTAALKKVEKGDPAATRAGILQGVNLAVGVALGAVVGFLVGGPIGLFVGAAIGAAVATVVNAQITKILATIISQAQRGGLDPGVPKEQARKGISQSQLAEQIKSGIANDVLLIILGGPIHALLSALLSGLVTPDIEKIFDKIFAETISKASGKFHLQINRHLEHFLGEGVAHGPRGREDVNLFRAPRYQRGPDGERFQVRPAGELRGEAYGAAALVAGLIGAGSENYERIHRFFLILANNLAQTRKPTEEIRQIIYQIVRGVTGNLTTGIAAVNVLFEHQQSAAEKAARAHKGLGELSKQEAQYARRTQYEIGLVADAYQVLIDKNTRAGATPISVRQIAEANSRVTGGVKLKSFQHDLSVSVLTAAAAGDLDLTKKLASKIGNTLVYAAATLKDKVPKGVDAIAVALKVAQSGVKHQTDEFLKALRIANLTAAAGGAEYTAKQARAAGDVLGFLAGKFKDLPAGVNAYAVALKVAQSDVKHQAREFIKELQRAALEAAAGGAEYTAKQAAELGDILGVLAATLQKQIPGFNFFAFALEVEGKNLAQKLKRLAEVGAVQAELMSKALPLLTEAEAELLRLPHGRGGVGRRDQKDLLAIVDARQTVRQFLDQTAATATGTTARETFTEIERKRSAAETELPQDLTTLHRRERALARAEASHDKEAADRARKHVQEARKAIEDLTNQAIEAAKNWGETVSKLVDSIRELDKAARDFNLTMNEQIATLRKSTDTASVYDTEITRQQNIINDTTQSAATRVQAVQDLAGVYQQQAQAEINDINRAADARKEALNKELDGIQALANLADSIHKQLGDLKLAAAGGGPGAGFQKIAYLQQQIAEKRRLFETSTGEDKARAASDVQDLIQQLLQVGGDFFGTTSGQYQALQKESIGILTELGDAADSAAKRAEKIQNEIKTIDQETKDAIDAVNLRLADHLEQLRVQAIPLFAEMRDTLVKQLGEQFPGLSQSELDDLINNPQKLSVLIQQGISDRLDLILAALTAASEQKQPGGGPGGGGSDRHPGVTTDDSGQEHAQLVAEANAGLTTRSREAIGRSTYVNVSNVIDAGVAAVETIKATGENKDKIIFVKAAIEGDVRGLASQLPGSMGFKDVARVAQFLSDDLQAATDNTKLKIFHNNIDDVLGAFFRKVKRLETGGVTTHEVLARVGEGNKPEAVLPLTDSRAMQQVGTAIAKAQPDPELPRFLSAAARMPELAAGGVTMHEIVALLGERGPEAVIPLTDPRALEPIGLALQAALSDGAAPPTSLKPQAAESATDLGGGGLQRFAAPVGGKVEIKATIVLQPAKGESEANVRLYMRTAKNEFEAQLVESAEHGALRKYLGKRQVR